MPYLINATGTTDGYQELGDTVHRYGSSGIITDDRNDSNTGPGVLLTDVTGLYESRWI